MNDEALVASVLASFNSAQKASETSRQDDTCKKVQSDGATTQAKSAPSDNKIKKKRKSRQQAVHSFPIDPRVITTIKTPRDRLNHSYRDFSSVPPTPDYAGPPTDIRQMTFAQKIHHILSGKDCPEDPHCHDKVISWLEHGRSFKVHIPAVFETTLCPKYFGHKRYSSFLRQLGNHGFKHITKGSDRNSYYNEFMLRGMSHLTVYMPEARDARRLIPDPDNEPNFYNISQVYPVFEQSLKPAAVVSAINIPAAASLSLSTSPLANIADPLTLATRHRLASNMNWYEQMMPPAKLPALSHASLPVASLPAPTGQLLDVTQVRSLLAQREQNDLQLRLAIAEQEREHERLAAALLQQQQRGESNVSQWLRRNQKW